MYDASNTAVGAVLRQKVDWDRHLTYYASKTLDSEESNYTTIEKELLAIVFSLVKFQKYILRTKVIICLDHTTIKYLLTKKDSKPRLIRWMLRLQEFHIEINDKSRKENLLIDHLSHIISPEDTTPISDTLAVSYLPKIPHQSMTPFQMSTYPWLKKNHGM